MFSWYLFCSYVFEVGDRIQMKEGSILDNVVFSTTVTYGVPVSIEHRFRLHEHRLYRR